MEYMDKAKILAKKIEREQQERLVDNDLMFVACDNQSYKTHIRPGRKYCKIDVGSSGKLMIDKEGNIFGIKAYGQVHLGHYYGTLATTDNYYWGDYYPRKR